MRRLAVSTAAVAGVLTLGMTATLTLSPSAGAATGFLAGHSHAAPAVASPNTRVKPGSVWTLTVSGVGCNVQTFASGNVVTTDTGFTGTWKKPTANTIKFNYPTVPAKYKGKYSKSLDDYTGTLVLSGTAYPGTTLTPGATSGC